MGRISDGKVIRFTKNMNNINMIALRGQTFMRLELRIVETSWLFVPGFEVIYLHIVTTVDR